LPLRLRFSSMADEIPARLPEHSLVFRRSSRIPSNQREKKKKMKLFFFFVEKFIYFLIWSIGCSWSNEIDVQKCQRPMPHSNPSNAKIFVGFHYSDCLLFLSWNRDWTWELYDDGQVFLEDGRNSYIFHSRPQNPRRIL
jgi:hypothetical protein